MTSSKTLGRAILCEFPTGEKFLVGEIEIDCPGCGQMTIRIAGHHLRSLNRILAEWIEQHPDLTGPTDVTVSRQSFDMRAPGADPANN